MNEVFAKRLLAGTTGEEMLESAIALTLEAPPTVSAGLFERLLDDITAAASAPGSDMRPWMYAAQTGTDSSRIFRGGIGLSIVVDPHGRLWRARTYEDFDTTYTITPKTCAIGTMTPKYAEMREYRPRR